MVLSMRLLNIDVDTVTGLAVYVLASVYFTKCITCLNGPFSVFAVIRSFAEKRYPVSLGQLLNCPWCSGFWVGMILAFLVGVRLELVWLYGAAAAAVSGLLLEA